MITADIKLGSEYHTQVRGDTIEEVLVKIREYHTMDSFEKDHYSKKGVLDQELQTGWYIVD
jgi:hypothetical protein